MLRRFCVLALLLGCGAKPASQAGQPPQPPPPPPPARPSFDARELEAFVETARTSTGTPGVAVAVVKDGAIVYEKGFGVREHGRSEPVTERTVFLLGSTTKAMSALLVGSLVDEGKLQWTTRVKDLDPSFTTGDAAYTERLTIGDTFCACTGWPRRDLEIAFGATTAEGLVAGFATQKPVAPYGSTYIYNNQVTALGGYLAGRAAEPRKPLLAAWSSAMASRIFAPIGMSDTTASFAEGKKRVATPHGSSALAPFEPVAMPIAIESPIEIDGPAGAVFSTAHDMGRYAIVELAKGVTPEGKRVFAASTVAERHRPRVKSGDDERYALGYAVKEQGGAHVVSHNGITFGFVSRVAFSPETNTGIVVLANSTDGALVVDGVTARFFEIVLGTEPRAAKDLATKIADAKADAAKLKPKLTTSFSAPLAARLAGTWKTPRLGPVTIARDGDGLTIDFGSLKTRLAHEGDDRFVLVGPPLGGIALRMEGDALVLDFLGDTVRFAKT